MFKTLRIPRFKKEEDPEQNEKREIERQTDRNV